MKEHMIQALTNTPKFKEIRASLREAMFQILAQKDQYQTTNFFAKNFLATEEGLLIGGIIKDYLEKSGFSHTLNVLTKEAGGLGKVMSREMIEKSLNKKFPESVPILICLLSKDLTPSTTVKGKMPSLTIPSFKPKNNLLDLLERPKDDSGKNVNSSNEENFDEDDDIDFQDLLHVPEDESSEDFERVSMKRKKSF
jgi:hypothetical protein